MEIKIIRSPISKTELKEIAREGFGDMVKAVVDVERKVMALGAELHADAETLLMEEEGSKREYTWGINLYPDNSGEEWLEFNSFINLKPVYGNRTRGVESKEIQKQIKTIIQNLVL